MLFFTFIGTCMMAFLILASGFEVYSLLFSCCCLYLGGNKFSLKFAGKMFKPTCSSISSMVGTYIDCKFLHFLCLEAKIKAKNSKNPPRENISRTDITMATV